MSAVAMNRARDLPGLPHKAVPVLTGIAGLLALTWCLHWVGPLFNPPLNTLRVEGALQRLSAAQIAEAAALRSGQHLFGADLDAARLRVEALPWVAHARVSRVWPDRIAVRVTERLPQARWGEAALIDGEGHAFAPAATELPSALPRLSGPDGREADVLAAYRSLRGALDGSRFAPAALMLDARGEWTATTSEGVSLRFGKDDPASRAPLLLGAVSAALGADVTQVAAIDLHYANGFAIGWKGGVAPFGRTAQTRTAQTRTAARPPALPATPAAAEEPKL